MGYVGRNYDLKDLKEGGQDPAQQEVLTLAPGTVSVQQAPPWLWLSWFELAKKLDPHPPNFIGRFGNPHEIHLWNWGGGALSW